MNTKITFAISCLVFLNSVSTHAQSPAVAPTAAAPTAAAPTAVAPTASAPTADSWPRVFNTDGFTVTVYPPAITTWDTRTLSGTSAFSRTASDGSALTYGTFSFTASTEVNRLNRMVTLTNLTITGVSLPDNPAAQATMQSKMQAMAQAKLGASINVSLDRLEAAVPTMSTSPHVNGAPLRNTVPTITVATTPTILVPVQGKPILKPLPGTKLQRVINTQMLLVQDYCDTVWIIKNNSAAEPDFGIWAHYTKTEKQ